MDDLSGKPLDGVRVTAAKHEELTEMYRRQVWVERPTSDCYRDTGKPPIPVRWVVTNKGDELHPNERCRLVAKHLAAKYGGKDAEDLFAAMPPFELIKSLLIKAVQRNNWRTTKRKVMFIDISKAHLYAPVDKGTRAYVDLPPECSQTRHLWITPVLALRHASGLPWLGGGVHASVGGFGIRSGFSVTLLLL